MEITRGGHGVVISSGAEEMVISNIKFDSLFSQQL
jgi:hypothetical protein